MPYGRFICSGLTYVQCGRAHGQRNPLLDIAATAAAAYTPRRPAQLLLKLEAFFWEYGAFLACLRLVLATRHSGHLIAVANHHRLLIVSYLAEGLFLDHKYFFLYIYRLLLEFVELCKLVQVISMLFGLRFGMTSTNLVILWAVRQRLLQNANFSFRLLILHHTKLLWRLPLILSKFI